MKTSFSRRKNPSSLLKKDKTGLRLVPKNLDRKLSKETCSLSVVKQLGKKTLDVANQLKLVDWKFEIQRKRAFLYVPLVKQPSEHDLKILKNSGINFTITANQFVERQKRGETFVEQLRGRLSPQLLAILPRSIDFIGDIAIVEIPIELRVKKKIIGEAILRSNRNVHTVLSKAGAINGTFRTRKFDLLAGEKTTETTHRENGCKYLLDISKVYFSPRLGYEHKRVASLVHESETVVDLFAGIGPFAILIAKTHENVQVYAVDANPYAIEYLNTNIRINRVVGKIHPLLGNARQVISGKTSGAADRVIMNLPGKAMEFVDVACKAIKEKGGIIHFYFFTDSSNSLETVKTRLAEAVEKSGRNVKTVVGGRIIRVTAPYEAQAVLDIEVG
jgi:tRNA (guanine37-N1)-methyltransferase